MSIVAALCGPAGGNMQSVRLHVTSDGVIWAMSKCKACGEVTKHLAGDAIVGPIACKRCGHPMDMKAATVLAVAAARDAGDLPGESAA
jgi:hypothetical protein